MCGFQEHHVLVGSVFRFILYSSTAVYVTSLLLLTTFSSTVITTITLDSCHHHL